MKPDIDIFDLAMALMALPVAVEKQDLKVVAALPPALKSSATKAPLSKEDEALLQDLESQVEGGLMQSFRALAMIKGNERLWVGKDEKGSFGTGGTAVTA